MRTILSCCVCLFFLVSPGLLQATDPIVLEAESGALTAPFTAAAGYISSPVRTTDPKVSGSARYSFNIIEAGNYVVELLVDFPSYFDTYASIDALDPADYSLDNFNQLGDPTTGFEWRALFWKESDGANSRYFSAGAHSFVFYGGTANIKLDKIRITRMPDWVLSKLAVPGGTFAGNAAIMSAGLGIQKQDRQGCYLNGKPFVCFIRLGLPYFEAVVPLPGPLPPKRYYLFAKGSTAGGFQASIVGNQASQTPQKIPEKQGSWTSLGSLDVSISPAFLLIRMFRGATPLSDKELSTLEGIYLTDNPNEAVNASDIIVPITPKIDADSSPEQKGNLIPNGSFEVGVLQDIVIGDRYSSAGDSSLYTSADSVWDRSVAYAGSSSLIVRPNRAPSSAPSTYQTVLTRSYHLKAGRKYTASAMVRAEVRARVVIRLVNTVDPSVVVERAYDPVTTGWQGVSISTVTNHAPEYRIELLVHNTTAPVWIDALQLEEGDGTAYKDSHSVELGLQIDSLGHIFYEDEAANSTLHLQNLGSSSTSKKLNFEAYDYLNDRIKSWSETILLSANEHATRSINLSLPRRGSFRLNYWIENEAGSEKEIVYSIIPRPVVIGSTQASFMGVHANIAEVPLQTAKRLGINWLRTLSTADLFRWQVAQWDEGQFKFFDQLAQEMTNRGFHVLGNLNLAVVPAWALTDTGQVRLDKWRTHVLGLVSHYKNWVKVWEIHNEPNQHKPALSTDYYAQMLKTAVDAIEEADPTATIVGMGGTDYAYMRDVIANLESLYSGWKWREHIDVLSTHAYAFGTGVLSAQSNIISRYSIPVWNTETGAWDMGSMVGDFTGFATYGRQIYPFRDADLYYRGAVKRPELVVQNFLSSIGGGQTKYFYYDSRASDKPYTTQPTFTEHDDSVRTKGIAYAIAGHFIDYASNLGEVTLPNLYAYLFEKGGTPILATWSKDYRNRTLATSLSAAQIKIYDMMGNEMSSASGIPVGRMPVYVKAVGVSAADFKTAIAAGTLLDRADISPPRVVIASGPRGPLASDRVRLRWFALDDTSIPEAGDLDPEQKEEIPGANPNALLYSYRLVGHSDTWSDWSAFTFIDYANLAPKSYLFEVRAKDEAGNISATVSRAVIITPPSTLPPAAPLQLRAG